MSLRVLGLAVVAASTLGCMTGPTNGKVFSGVIQGASFPFGGYTTTPAALVEVQVANPDGGWVTLSTTTSAATGLNVNGDLLYSWSTTGVPVPTSSTRDRWPEGGLVKLRALVHEHATDGGTNLYTAYTFDDATWSSCLNDELVAGTPGTAIGTNCNGLGRNQALMVSTHQNPAELLTRDFLAIKGDGASSDYYSATHASATLAAFKSEHLWPGAGELVATYYNDADLGIGRELHCWSYTPGFLRRGRACFVSNYSDVARVGKFGNNDLTATFNNVTAHQQFATVAMVYEQNSLGVSTVNFVVFDADGNRTDTAVLDRTAHHTSVPNNCLTCHGLNARVDPTSHLITGDAHFLPLDVASFKFAGSFTRAAQEESFRRLNAFMKETSPTPAISDFIDGSYGGAVSVVGTTFRGDYVPAGWATGPVTNRSLYQGVVAGSCRSCHLSASSPTEDFLEVSDFNALKSVIASHACATGDARFMPHAEHVMRRFWESGARAYLSAWTGRDCKP